jgi:hypothetical protein
VNLCRIKCYLYALAIPVLFVGCENTINPLIGWQLVGDTGYTKGGYQSCIDKIPFEKAIAEDIRDFVEKLPIVRSKYGDRSENYWIDEMSFFDDGAGQRAVRICIPLEGTYQNYALIYDKLGKRVKVIKFASGHYAC